MDPVLTTRSGRCRSSVRPQLRPTNPELLPPQAAMPARMRVGRMREVGVRCGKEEASSLGI